MASYRLRCLVGGPPSASSGGGLGPWRPRSSSPLPLLLGWVARPCLAGLVGFAARPVPRRCGLLRLSASLSLGRRARRAGRRCPPSCLGAPPLGACAPCAAPAGCGRSFWGPSRCAPLRLLLVLAVCSPLAFAARFRSSAAQRSMDKLTGQGPPTYPPPLLLKAGLHFGPKRGKIKLPKRSKPPIGLKGHGGFCYAKSTKNRTNVR